MSKPIISDNLIINSGLTFNPGLAPVSGAGVAIIRLNSGNSNLEYSINGSAYANLISSGITTGNFTFSGNVVDLSAAAAMSIGSTNTSSIKFSTTAAAQVATLGISTQFGATYYELQSNAANFGFRNSVGTGPFPQGTSLFSYVNGIAIVTLDVNGQRPITDNSLSLGGTGQRWSNTYSAILTTGAIQNSSAIVMTTTGDTDGVRITNFGASVPAISFGDNATTNRYIFGSSGAVSINSGGARVSLGSTNNDWSPSSDLNSQLGVSTARWTNVYSAASTVIKTALAATSPLGSGYLSQNNTAATSSVQQYSPLVELSGQGWGTTGSASQDVRWAFQAQPASGTTPTVLLSILQSINGAAYSQKAAFTSTGAIVTPSIGASTSVLHTVPAGTASTLATIGNAQTFSAVQTWSAVNVVNGSWTWSAQQTFSKAIRTTTVALTAAATVTPDCSTSNVFSLTLANTPTTIANPTNLVTGQQFSIILTQDATGSRTVTWGSNFKWPGGTAPTLSTAAGSVDMVSCIYNGTIILSVANLKFS